MTPPSTKGIGSARNTVNSSTVMLASARPCAASLLQTIWASFMVGQAPVTLSSQTEKNAATTAAVTR